MSSATLLQTLQLVSLLGSALTVFRLFHTGLYHQYRVFFWYFVFRIPNSIGPLALNVNSGAYFVLWVITSPILCIFYVLMVVEVYRIILQRHQGLYTLGRWAMYFSTLVAVTISILTLLPKFTPSVPQMSRYIGFGMAIDRGVDSSVVIFMLLMVLFLGLYPVPLSRNAMVHISICFVYLMSITVAGLLRTIWGVVVNNQVNLLLVAASAACTLAWAVLLTPKGEETRVSLPVFSAEHEERVLAKLDALNSTLLKASRN